MSETLSHQAAQLLIATRQGLFGARVDSGEMDIFPFALHGIALRSLLTDVKGVPVAAGSSERGVWLTRDGGKTWFEGGGTTGLAITALCGDGPGLAAGTADGEVLSGRAGQFASRQPVCRQQSAVSALLSAAGQVFAALADGGLFSSPGGGASFREVGSGLPPGVLALAVSGDQIWAGTRRGLYSTLLSHPGSWSLAFAPDERPAVTAVGVDPANPRHMVCAAARQVGHARPGDPKGADAWLYASDDAGKRWSALASPRLPVMRAAVTDFVFHPRTPGRLFAGTTVGEIFETTEGGNSFVLAAGSLPGVLALAPGPVLY